jgi:hypothetical protein
VSDSMRGARLPSPVWPDASITANRKQLSASPVLGSLKIHLDAYAGRIHGGHVLLSVHCDNAEWANTAVKVLRESGAGIFPEQARRKRNWTPANVPTSTTGAIEWLETPRYGDQAFEKAEPDLKQAAESSTASLSSNLAKSRRRHGNATNCTVKEPAAATSSGASSRTTTRKSKSLCGPASPHGGLQ